MYSGGSVNSRTMGRSEPHTDRITAQSTIKGNPNLTVGRQGEVNQLPFYRAKSEPIFQAPTTALPYQGD